MTATSTSSPRPLKPITSAQLKALHAIGRRRGLSHENLRDAAGVASLKSLSVTEGARLIERLQTDDYQRPMPKREPDRAHRRGVIRLATDRQRNYIAHLFERLGWDAEKSARWLRERHGITDLAGGVFTARTASEAVYQLEQALAKAEPKRTPSDASDGAAGGRKTVSEPG